MLETSGLFRLLGDDVRLRLLRLVTTERLNVSELTAILGIAQSGVSRHLGLLREAGLVRESREAGFTYYCSATDESEAESTSVWPMLRARLGAESPAAAKMFGADDARLKEVKRQRREQRDTHGTAVDGNGRQLVSGRSWAAWSRALGLLLSDMPWPTSGAVMAISPLRWRRGLGRQSVSTSRLMCSSMLARWPDDGE